MTSKATAGQDEDLYGQVHPEETPQLIAEGLEQLKEEVAKLSEKQQDGWIQAQQKCAANLIGDEHQLMFLRCEVFNADLAAKRLTNYWNTRVEIFGDEKAFLPLALDGALVDDEVALDYAFVRLVEGAHDPSGRAVVYADPSRQDKTKYTRESMLRAFWYTIHAALEDTKTQQHGIVFVANPSKAKFSQFDRTQVKMNIASIQGCLPVRISALHICHPPSFFALIFPIIKLFMSDRLKKRIKVHTGSEEKVLQKLSKYGLTRDELPIDLGGTVSLDHKSWLESRRDSDM